MAGLDDVGVREGVDLRDGRDGALGRRALQVRLLERHRDRVCAEGAQRGYRPPDLRQERRARVDARLAPAAPTAAGCNSTHEPTWAMLDLPDIDFQDQYYYARPKSMAVRPKSLEEVDPALLATYEKLGIPLKEQMILAGVEGADGAPVEGRKVAVDAVFDSVSVGTTFQAELARAGVIFCSISEAIREHPELVQEVPRQRRALQRQLLRDAELGGVLRRLLRLRAAGRALPDGAFDLLPHQRREYRPVRADADHRRQGQLRLLSRGLHGAEARHRPASCRGRRDRACSRTPR